MIAVALAKQPYKNIGQKIAHQKNWSANAFKKEKQNSSQEKQRKSVGENMNDVAVNERAGNNTNQSGKRSGFYAQQMQIPRGVKLHRICYPHQENQPKG